MATCGAGEMGAGQGLGFESEQCFDGAVGCGRPPCYSNNKRLYSDTTGTEIKRTNAIRNS